MSIINTNIMFLINSRIVKHPCTNSDDRSHAIKSKFEIHCNPTFENDENLFL